MHARTSARNKAEEREQRNSEDEWVARAGHLNLLGRGQGPRRRLYRRENAVVQRAFRIRLKRGPRERTEELRLAAGEEVTRPALSGFHFSMATYFRVFTNSATALESSAERLAWGFLWGGFLASLPLVSMSAI